jgi:ubiquinol-cytochrome c reductase cytochrome b subunit
MEENVSVGTILQRLMIDKVPNYANRVVYSLGFLSMICFMLLIVTGSVMVFFGPNWWLTSSVGQYFRSIHLWSTQAFVMFMILHLIIVFFTSGFRGPRRLTWVIGALMFMFVLAEAEFGYVLRGDFSSQWRSLQGADFYNGSGIGAALNSLNYQQIYGIHIILVPLVILGLLFCHYVLVKVRGIAKPYRPDITYKMEKASHIKLFARGFVLIALIAGLAVIFPSPFVKPDSISDIATSDPAVVAQTIVSEFNATSDTATYSDGIEPYTYDTRAVYVNVPYNQLVAATGATNKLSAFDAESASLQTSQLKAAADYYAGAQKSQPDLKNPVIAVSLSLVQMAKTGLYESALDTQDPSGDKTTYTTRFLSDTGVLDTKATALGITTAQYGMLHEESSKFPLGGWWLSPLGLLDNTVLATDANGDRDGSVIIGLFFLLLVAFPYIPYLNKLPDKLKVYKLIWHK